MALPAAAAALEYYADRVKATVEEKGKLEAKVRELAEAPRWKSTVDALRCMKEVETVTAMALACEVDLLPGQKRVDPLRLDRMVPSESSSSERLRRGRSRRPATSS